MFNHEPMDDKTDVQGEWSTEALALLDRLDSTNDRAANSNKRRATSRQSVGDASQDHSQNSQAGQSTARGTSRKSRSQKQQSSMSQASLSPHQPDDNRHQLHSQSQNGDTEMNLMHARETDPLPFGEGHWQGYPAGPSMEGPADNLWEAPDDAPQVPPNKRRRTQENGPTGFARAPSRKQQREAPVARFTQVSPVLWHCPQLCCSRHSLRPLFFPTQLFIFFWSCCGVPDCLHKACMSWAPLHTACIKAKQQSPACTYTQMRH